MNFEVSSYFQNFKYRVTNCTLCPVFFSELCLCQLFLFVNSCPYYLRHMYTIIRNSDRYQPNYEKRRHKTKYKGCSPDALTRQNENVIKCIPCHMSNDISLRIPPYTEMKDISLICPFHMWDATSILIRPNNLQRSYLIK